MPGASLSGSRRRPRGRDRRWECGNRKARRGIWPRPCSQHLLPQKSEVGPLNIQCSATKANGQPCTLPANGPSGYCWAHAPENAEKRRRTASRAARSKGNKEVLILKEEIKAVIADVRAGALDRNDAGVMIQGYRALKDFIALERQVKETDELAAEIEELKREFGIA